MSMMTRMMSSIAFPFVARGFENAATTVVAARIANPTTDSGGLRERCYRVAHSFLFLLLAVINVWNDLMSPPFSRVFFACF